MNRRKAVKCIATLASATITKQAMAAEASKPNKGEKPSKDPFAEIGPYPSAMLPSGVRSRFVDNINGLRMHVLEAGYEEKNRPGVLLLHGFPELAYSWRRVMAKMPTYYIMDLADSMAETVAKYMPSASDIAVNDWLPDNELVVYPEEFR